VVKIREIMYRENFYSEDLNKEDHFGHIVIDGKLIVRWT
jgi:hypothetical protein